MQALKFLLSWIAGVIIAVLALNLFSNEGIDWAQMFGLILGGIIGVAIVTGMIKVLKK
ncbi:hypothetical protein [Virgibacillus kimchii]